MTGGNQSWPVRCAHREETEAVLAVRNLAYPPNAALARSYWEWRYYGNPSIPSKMLIAESEGEIIGLQPMASLPALAMGQPVTMATLTGVVTHPDFRRKGVFTRLVTQSLEEARQDGDQLVYTFPNRLSLPGFMRAGGWLHVGSLPLYVKSLDWDAILQTRMTNPGLVRIASSTARLGFGLIARPRLLPASGVAIRHVAAWDAGIEAFWARASALHDSHYLVQRSHGYLTWRYVQHPEEQYVLLQAEQQGMIQGYAVVKTTELFDLRAGLIVDLLALHPRVSDALVAGALEYLSEVKAEIAGALISDVLFYPGSLRRNGFVRCPIKLCPREFFFVAQIISPQATAASDLKNWFLTWGDTDNV